MSTYCRKIAQLIVLLMLGVVVAAPAAADLVLTAPPRESAAKAKEVYQPIADFLSKVAGQKVVFRYSDNWLSYQSDMRKGIYDIVVRRPALHQLAYGQAGPQPARQTARQLGIRGDRQKGQ